jgi:dienelactone hydrolase
MPMLLLFFCGFLLAGLTTASAEEPLVVEETFLSVTVKDVPYRLEAMFVKEAGAKGRLPIALITHGQAAEAEKREVIEARGFLQTARDFARRGWLAAVVIRRGFGRSEGKVRYVLRHCREGDFSLPLGDQTDDLEAAIQAIGRRLDADPSTVLALGASMGGAAVLDLAARQPAGLKAVVNISGGIKSMPRSDGEPASCKAEDLVPLFAGLGERSRLPTLWLYAENDSLFPGDYARQLHEAYVAKGGRTEFHMFDPIGEDGHFMRHPDGLLRWLPALDGFLRANGLKTYDPGPIAAATKALNLAPGLREVLRRYEGRPTEKILAISQSRKFLQAQFGGRDLAAVEAKALEECGKRANEPCQVLLRNFEPAEGIQSAADRER